jgi:hypothetical protein
VARVLIRKVADRWDEVLLTIDRPQQVLVPLVRLEDRQAAGLHCALADADAEGHQGELVVRLGRRRRLRLQEPEWRVLLAALWDWSVRYEEEEDAILADDWGDT